MTSDTLEFDEEMIQELLDVFILEFEELLELYSESLHQLRSIQEDKLHALKEIFRVYHTWKGDAGYFGEYGSFVNFANIYTERLRHVDDTVLSDEVLMRELQDNYSRISSTFNALNNGSSLKHFRFKLFLRNF